MDNTTFGAAVAVAKKALTDPTVIEGAVSDWLDDHPEATTTVQDGSITKAKLDASLQGTVDDVSNLKTSVTNLNVTPTYTITAGYYLNTSGVLSTSSNYSMTSDIALKKGDKITFTTHVKTACALGKHISGSTYSVLINESTNPDAPKDYSYTATEDMNVVISERGETLSNVKVTRASYYDDVIQLYNDVKHIDDAVGTSKVIVPEYTLTAGTYINASSQTSSSSNYSMTSAIALLKGDVLRFTTLVRTACALARQISNSQYKGLIIESGYVSDPKDYEYVATEDMNVVICERGDTLSGVSITRYPAGSLIVEVNQMSGFVGSVETATPDYTLIDGYKLDSSGVKQSDANYQMTSPIRVKPGDILHITTMCRTATVLAESLGNDTYRWLIREMTNALTPLDYTYHVGKAMDVVAVGRDNSLSMTMTRYSDDGLVPDVASVNEALPHGSQLVRTSLNGNMSIKAFREYRFSDGTLPLYKDVLWYDGNGGFWLSDNVYSTKKHIFGWSDILSDNISPDMYSAFIVHDGSILFVYGTQFQSNAGSATPGDDYRRNPIIYQLVNGEYVGSIIDFGDNLKPTNWLQNIGIIESARYDCLVFCEYTRALESTARVWRVTFPLTDPTNWDVVLYQSVAHPYGEGGFKHYHSVQEDPYYDIIYVTSGDDATSCGCWSSTDGGENFTQVGNYDNAKWRLLNMIFREDYVYWASDDWTPRHKFWKASRDASTHIIDYSSITEVCSFPDNSGSNYVATYASIYLPTFNAVLFLDRDDSDDSITALPINLYDLDADQLYIVGWLKPADLATYNFIGFRNDAVLLAPRDNKIAVGYSEYYANYNKLLGNIGTHSFETQINNLVLTIDRTDSGYAVSFDTVI